MSHFLPTDGSIETTTWLVWRCRLPLWCTVSIAPSGTKRFLAYNPSHLEVVNAVVTGQTRAAQENKER